ncbi:aromatic ring-hydroxylating oxygenase subunit alpha [Mastigocoleus testarum]|uniref:Rieske domain-containing protein n=1 Tax=Mastigocoleus testarum BC008 TaxID=371196 RepID=A0A0V7ZBA6_9CYAN|nr:aromatic ring-hydroxylating dioxygenase subunit alpha [Mastigocoleus testarum]KST61781.1 hypothetical protein BC008_06975 [Mastigocoleus testarum BC008]
MIFNYWYAIFESKKLRHKPVHIKRMGEELVLWRDAKGKAICMIDRCPHRGAALSLGKVKNDCIECPYHGFQYDIKGQCRLMPCIGKNALIPPGFRVKKFPTREAQEFIWIWWGEERLSLPDLPWFEELPNDLAHTAESSQVWDIHYSRIMENNFDIHHLPFVHRSVTPGVGTLLDPYKVEVNGDFIRTWGQLRQDNGKSAEESPGWFFRIIVIFPQLTLLELAPKVRLVVVVTPIDRDYSWVAIRYYQDYVKLPVIGWFVSWLILMVEFKIFQEKQDLPILRSLKPKNAKKSTNKLVYPDTGSAHYLKRHEQLMYQNTHKNIEP